MIPMIPMAGPPPPPTAAGRMTPPAGNDFGAFFSLVEPVDMALPQMASTEIVEPSLVIATEPEGEFTSLGPGVTRDELPVDEQEAEREPEIAEATMLPAVWLPTAGPAPLKLRPMTQVDETVAEPRAARQRDEAGKPTPARKDGISAAASVTDVDAATTVRGLTKEAPGAQISSQCESIMISAIQGAAGPAGGDTSELSDNPGAALSMASDADLAPLPPDSLADQGFGQSHNGGSRAERSAGSGSQVERPGPTAEAFLLRQASEALAQARTSPGVSEILLSEPGLGELSMTVSQDGGLVSVTVAADRADTLDLVRRNIDLLARDLRELGFQSLNFSFQQGSGAEGGGQPAGPWLTEAGADPLPPVQGAELSVVSRPAAVPTGSGLDLRI